MISRKNRSSIAARVPDFTSARVYVEAGRETAASFDRQAAILRQGATARQERGMYKTNGGSGGVNRVRRWIAPALSAALVLGMPAARADDPTPMSAEARAVFDRAKDTLVQLRVIHRSTRAQSATGSGFIASPDGLVVTNYHVVSKLALEPGSYELELKRSDGSSAKPQLLAVDVASDLAVLTAEGGGQPSLAIREAPLIKGDRGFALGHPLDLGPTIVEGTYNGYVETEFVPRIHFSGAVNPGMSGGPAVALDGKVFGVNVARRLDGQLVSYLVPPDRVAAILRRVAAQERAPVDFRKEVAAQLLAQQERLFARLLASPMGTTRMGGFSVPDAQAPFIRCSGFAEDKQTRLYDRDTKYCMSSSGNFVDDGLRTGQFQFIHRLFEARALGAVRFAGLVEQAYGSPFSFEAEANRKELTAFRCQDDFVRRPDGTLRIALCTRAYRSFDGLYDFHLRAVTVDSTSSALLSTLTLSGVSFENGLRFAQRYVEAISWTK
jgi:S1-C subfamily serine protease